VVRRSSARAANDRKRDTSPSISPSDGLAAAILRHVDDAVFVVDADNRVIEWTESAARLFRLSEDEATGQWLGAVLPFAVQTPTEQELLAAVRAGRAWRGEGLVSLRDGTERWIQSTLAPLSLPGHGACAVAVSRDMTGQREEARSHAATERGLRTLGRLNRELVRDTDEAALLDAACQIVVEVGGYRLAWIGYTRDDASETVEPVAAAAADGERVVRPDPKSVAEVHEHGPTLTALRTRQPALVHDQGDPSAGSGVRDLGVAAFPLSHGDQLFGVATVHAAESGAFGEAELETLAELAADLGYGIAARRTQAAHDAAARRAEADESVMSQIRTGLAEIVQQVAADAPLEAIADTICRRFATVPGVDAVAVAGFVSEDAIEIIASITPDGWPRLRQDSIPAGVARYLRGRALGGPWVEQADALRANGWVEIPAAVQAVAFGPIVHGDHVEGGLGVGTKDAEFADSLVNRLPALAAFSATASGLLAKRLHDRRAQDERRRQIEAVIAARAFHPVFQVLVDLETREAVGYEALTRFDSGERPDTCFADAWVVGLGPDLELATIEAAASAARTRLPPGLWLNVNISPRLLLKATELCDILATAGHPVVVEVTEHEVVTDYDGVRNAVRRLGKDVRLAVDDAGAGVANFGHIIELGSDFVKLDMSLVRRVNAHLGRQALVVGMQRFARSAGCRLIAEGVETELEAATLLELGVEFGQGYLFGAPQELPSDPPRRRPAARRRSGRRRLVDDTH
jgi:PAS domain S-box-containing protein